MLTLILAEAALETVPQELWSHPAVKNHAKRLNKPPSQLLLDRSLHHAAMKQLKDNEKRGRPDITHFVLLEALSSPLNKQGLLRIYVHTVNDQVVTVDPNTRLPRNYNRFTGLIEQLFQQNKVPAQGETLLKLENKTLKQLLNQTKTDHVLAFSRKGKPQTIHTAIANLQTKQNPTIIIGGFPHNNFTKATTQQANQIICIDNEMLDAWTVASRAIYEYERTIELPTKRLPTN